MPQTGRSGCPINLTLEQLGDRWSLIVIRDVMFGNRRSYSELFAQSEEGRLCGLSRHRRCLASIATPRWFPISKVTLPERTRSQSKYQHQQNQND